MTRRRYRLLTWVAHNWPWAWVNLVSQGDRLMWANISAASIARSLHVRQWTESLDAPPLPAWVPCQACGGRPCQWRPPATIASLSPLH